MRFGVCTEPENANSAKKAGFDYIELGVAATLRPEAEADSVLPGIVRLLTTSGLVAETYNGFLPSDLKVVGPDVDSERLARYAESTCARAAALGGAIVVFGSGGQRRIPDGFDTAVARGQIIAFLRVAAESAAKHGIRLVIEPLNSVETNHVNSVAEAVTLARELNAPNVGVLSDLYHVLADNQSYDETREAGALLWHVHIAGKGRRAPMADDVDLLTPYFAVLKNMGYTGRVSVEARWDNFAELAPEACRVLWEAWERA